MRRMAERRSARLDLRLPPEKLERWRAFAQAEGRTLTSIIEGLVDEAISVSRTIRRDEAREVERARHYHSLDPTEARRRDWGRTP